VNRRDGTEVHQLVPSLSIRDAIGNHALQVRRLLLDLGYRSDLHADNVTGRFNVPVHRASAVPEGTWLIFHHSIGSGAAARFAAHRGGRVLNYHNITPAELFAPWEAAVAAELDLGRRQLAGLANLTHHAVADSGFNRDELVDLGFPSTGVAPILFDPGALARVVDRSVASRLATTRSRQGTQVLFVGRMAPNKAQHALVAGLAVYRREFDPGAHLHLVGGVSSPTYEKAVRRQVQAAGLRRAVTFHDSVSDGALAAHYLNADVFCCLSDHEGFGVPLLEAMAHDVPVVARAGTGVSGTVGEAAILLPDRDPVTTAVALHRVCSDGALRERVVAAGRRRLEELSIDRARRRYAEQVAAALEQSLQ
jgi:L-malate glycosyltransferase